MPKPKLIEFNGKIASIKEHCKDLGINSSYVYSRHHKTGDSYEECLSHYQKNGVLFRNITYKIQDKRLYRRWDSIKQRCENHNDHAYELYGGRGILICERWQLYENFEKDLLESFLKHVEKYGIHDTTIDRWPDKMGNYEPNNVRWATRIEQQNNLNTNVMVTKDLNVAQFAKKYDIPYHIVSRRFKAGWTVEEILNTPIDTHNTRKNSISYVLPCNIGLRKYCVQNNYCYTTIHNYIKKYNLEPDEALARYLKNKQKKNN